MGHIERRTVVIDYRPRSVFLPYHERTKRWSAIVAHRRCGKTVACVNDLIPPMVAEMKEKGIAIEDKGALIIPVKEESDKQDIPPLILIKSDGAAMYGTTDLATIVDRVNCQNPDRSVYVVDHRQSLHFVQVFRAAMKAGINGKGTLFHLGYGTMNGTDGKPFKTRDGGTLNGQISPG